MTNNKSNSNALVVKRNDNSTKRVARPRKRATNENYKGTVPTALVSAVCGLTDPFCAHASGAKYMDDSSTRTLPFRVHTTKTYSTDVNGRLAVTFFPQIGQGFELGSSAVDVNGVSTTNLSFDAATVTALSGSAAFRTVSAGIRIRCVAPVLTVSGLIHVRSWQYTKATSFITIDGASFNASKTNDVALSDAKDECFIFEHTSQPAQAFYPLQNPFDLVLLNNIPRGFNPISVTVMGGPASTPVISIEYIQHVEYVFNTEAPLSLATTPSPPYNPALASAATIVTSGMESFGHSAMEAAAKYVKDRAMQALKGLFAKNIRTAPLALLVD